jgi:cell division transport system permease protein
MARPGALPMSADPAARFLPWLMAVMVFVATLALAGTLALSETITRWDRSLSATLTVQIPATAGEDRAALSEEVLSVLRDTPGIAAATPVPADRMAALLAPWLGTDAVLRTLPLPTLIDIQIGDRRRLDRPRLRSRLAGVAPGISVDDHGRWLERLVRLGRTVSMAIIAYTARTGVAVHRGIIELLHLMGARDNFIARQFAREAGRAALIGGAAGLLMAALALFAVGLFSAQLDDRTLPGLILRPLDWSLLALLPLAGALVARATAWLTVIRTLARLP